MKNKPKRMYLTALEQPETIGQLNFFPHDPVSSSGVKKLRDYTKIEKLIKNKKSDLQRALVIAKFTSEAWGHDGFNSNPKKQDALTIFKLAAKGSSFACVQFASVFTQLCQSVGIPARVLQVRTRHPDLGDSGHGHVTAEYFDNDLAKWVWVDPQIHAYATYQGKPLSQNELAELIVNKAKPQLHFSARTIRYLKGDKSQLARLKVFVKRYIWSSRVGGLDSFYTNQKHIQIVGCKRKGVLSNLTFQGFAIKSADFISREMFDAQLNSCQMKFETFPPKRQHKYMDLADYKANAYLNFAKPVVKISLTHSTPWFSHFLVFINGKRRIIKTESFSVNLINGKNRIEVRAVNAFKRIGPSTKAMINFDSKYKIVKSFW